MCRGLAACAALVRVDEELLQARDADRSPAAAEQRLQVGEQRLGRQVLSLSGGDEEVVRLGQLQVRVWGAGRLERRGGEVAQRHAGDVRSVELDRLNH